MPQRHLSDWINGYLEYLKELEPPELFKLWVAIGAVAACLQRKCWLNWKMDKIFPNMYIILCGPPASRKGTAMRPARYFLEKLGIPLAVEATTREALIRKLSGSTIQEPDFPEREIELSTHSSLTVFSEELTVFLGQNNWQLMSDLNNWFDCDSHWSYETVSRGEDSITGVWVNLIGATTPEFLESALPQDAIGGGLTSRIIFVFGDRKSKIVSSPELTDAEMALQELLLEDLDQIQMLRGEFQFTQRYFDKYDRWYTEHNRNPPFEDRNFLGYNERKALHLRKLSMVLCASRRDGNMILTEQDFDRALAILNETEKYMRFAFSARGRSSHAWLIEQIIRTVMLRGEVQIATLYREFYKDAIQDDIDSVLRHLRNANIIEVVYDARTLERGSSGIIRFIPEKRRKFLDEHGAGNSEEGVESSEEQTEGSGGTDEEVEM